MYRERLINNNEELLKIQNTLITLPQTTKTILDIKEE